jgi:hypothetical protein
MTLRLKHPTMAKSLVLLLCCAFFFQALRAQDRQTADEQLLVYTGFPQKLEFRKADIGWSSHPNYFAKKIDADDDVRSILYQQVRRDSFNLDLPKLKNQSFDVHAHVHRPLPLFSEQ